MEIARRTLKLGQMVQEFFINYISFCVRFLNTESQRELRQM